MSATPEMTNVFQFMELRAPYSPEAKTLRQNYIRDDFICIGNDGPARLDTDLQSTTSPSGIGRIVYEQIFCPGDSIRNLDSLIAAVLSLLTPYQPLCSISLSPCPPPQTLFLPLAKARRPETDSPNGVKPLSITELERRAHIIDGELYYLLPERIEQIEGLTLYPELLRALEVIERARSNIDLSKLVEQLVVVFGGKALREIVFENGAYTSNFQTAKRKLFDTLYLLYILRRRTTVNLEYVIEGLRELHVLEAIAIDNLVKVMKAGSPSRGEVIKVGPLSKGDAIKAGLLSEVETIKAGPPSQSDTLLKQTLKVLFPELRGWNGKDPLSTLPLIQTKDDFNAYFAATPIIHPIFARLFYYRQPFNDIKPIGIGDLKVVKQWLVGYKKGEIAHIENVLKDVL